MLPLDVRSAFLCSAVIAAVFAAALILLWRRDRQVYLAAWSGGYACLTASQMLAAARGYLPDLLSIVFASSGLLTGGLLLYAGAAQFHRRSPRWVTAAAIVIVSTAEAAWYTFALYDIDARTLINSVSQLAVLVLLLMQFFGPGWRVRWSGSALAIVFSWLYGCVLIVRCAWTLTGQDTGSFFAPTDGQNAILLLQVLASIGMGLGLYNLHAVTLIQNLRESEQRLAEANESLTKLTVRLELRNTEYAEARDLAEAANRSKSQFLANMSHELRTPLNAIIGFSDMIRNGTLGPIGQPVYRDYATDIHASGQHLLQLVTDILDMSRAEAGHLALNEEICDPARVVESSVSMLRHPAQRGAVTIETEVSQDTPWLFADERRLRQVLINLLSNAVKFTRPGGRVTVSLGVDTCGALAFMVEDTGIGMTEDHIEIALTPFGQVESHLNRRFEGAGLGLPLSRQLLDLHEGELEIASCLGHGTKVTARFPAERIRPRLV
jgi:signal transduction histidine kinase